jgi:hypothetical protein
MPAPRNRRHILVPGKPSAEAYTPHLLAILPKPLPIPTGGRAAHGARLKSALLRAERDAAARRAHGGIEVHGAEPGLYVEFESAPGIRLNVSKLENRRKQIEVVAVSEDAVARRGAPNTFVERATVFVPDGELKHFVKRFEEYSRQGPKKKGERRHEDMLDRVAALKLATLRALWTDEPGSYPDGADNIWWEVWLRKTDGKELDRLLEFAELAELQVAQRRLEFDERIVVLVFGSAEDLSASLDVLNDFAEVRRAKELATFFVDLGNASQGDWASDLRRRLKQPGIDDPAVCVLDTGVTRAHPLLGVALAAGDRYAVNPDWGVEDDGGGEGIEGHGTEMAGLALYGKDLPALLASTGPVRLRHRLESVKILPPPQFASNAPDLYGAVTATGVAYPESKVLQRKRVFSLAVTAKDGRDRGQPTSWSAAVDALAAGRMFDAAKQGLVYLDDAAGARRLFVVSAGNVQPPEKDHLDRSDAEPVHDPAQAWNALTVGAYTDLCTIEGLGWSDFEPLAPGGELSPWSTTSVGFARKWPIKPDVVAEGGNIGVNGAGEVDYPIPSLELLTAFYKPSDKLFVTAAATSAATAQVARLCAMVFAEYPEYWPETVRGVVVHSAEWTSRMRGALERAARKRPRLVLVRRYGYGVPSLVRALRSADDALSLVAQATIRPFADGKMREMHVYELPWPKAALEALGETKVRLRVTLSYFVEPNPARRGWQKRHRYQSHGLRFDVKKGSLESLDDFRKRLNQKALEEEEDRPATAADEGWFLGEQARTTGSVHSDVWEGTAADLADRGVIAVYPVTGWWKDQPHRDRSEKGARYALVVSIETPGVESDIWTPVAQQVGVDVEAVVEV